MKNNTNQPAVGQQPKSRGYQLLEEIEENRAWCSFWEAVAIGIALLTEGIPEHFRETLRLMENRTPDIDESWREAQLLVIERRWPTNAKLGRYCDTRTMAEAVLIARELRAAATEQARMKRWGKP